MRSTGSQSHCLLYLSIVTFVVKADSSEVEEKQLTHLLSLSVMDVCMVFGWRKGIMKHVFFFWRQNSSLCVPGLLCPTDTL